MSRGHSETEQPKYFINSRDRSVETMGLEPTTSGLQSPRSTN